jgi:hypothetical protein
MVALVAVVAAGLLAFVQPAPLTTTPVEITTADGTATEIASAERLRELLDTLDVDRWIFSPRVIVKDRVIPHSHPTVTVRAGDPDDQLLANYVHENIHWYVVERDEAYQAALAEIRLAWPDLPIVPPEGARDEASTWLHVVVCALEYKAMQEILGEGRARELFEFWATHHYKAIYRLVLAEDERIMAILDRHGLSNS